MGLDMQLVANRVLSPMEEAVFDDVVRDLIRKVLDLSDTEHRTEISIVVGDWRGAHAIHLWITDRAKPMPERYDLNRYYLSRKQLEDLHDLCSQALANKSLADDLLPPFDEGDYRYFEHLEDTIQIINKALQLDEREWEFEYRFSL